MEPEIRLAVGSAAADSNRSWELAARVSREPSFIAITNAESLATTRSPGINGHAVTPAVLTRLPSSSKEEEPETVAIG
jgi:hypothetical protein